MIFQVKGDYFHIRYTIMISDCTMNLCYLDNVFCVGLYVHAHAFTIFLNHCVNKFVTFYVKFKES